ncbi:MAG: GTPase domain-containing protein [Caldimonas sp.]
MTMSGIEPSSTSAASASPRTSGDIALSLVSHTNAGKTTLARTLLGRDVGEVRDAPHVTEFADAHVLVETPGGDRLRLWDTPGFGDSIRLVQRLRQTEQPLRRFLSEVWDRWRDRPFWASQQAIRNVRDEADVLLYLVNASESVEAAGYVAPEMELLGWIGKPVIVLLNQLGAPRPPGVEAAEVERWRGELSRWPQVRAVLPLDAFARCWVQELTLFAAVEQALPDAARVRMARLRAAWAARRLATFEAAVQAIAASLSRIAAMREPVPEGGGLRARIRQAGAAIGMGKGEPGPAAEAQRALAAGLDDELRASTRELLALHGLGGSAEDTIRDRLAAGYDLRLKLDEAQAAMWGGAVTGALVGLKADVLSGGLTLGGGLIAGGVIGALGSAGLARCVNLVRGTGRSFVTWNPAALDTMAEAALLRLLAVEHFGRGRGDWLQGEAPPHWQAVVTTALAPLREALDAAWSERRPAASDDGTALAERLTPVVRTAARQALLALYPDAGQVWPAEADDDALDEQAAHSGAPSRT